MMPDTDSAAHDHDISTLCDDAIFMLDVLCCRSDQDHDYANADGDDADLMIISNIMIIIIIIP